MFLHSCLNKKRISNRIDIGLTEIGSHPVERTSAIWQEIRIKAPVVCGT